MLRSGRKPTDTIPTSSMADIAFLLLIFFLVTTVFPKDKGLALVLPQEQTEVNEANIMHLLIESEGLVTVRVGASPQSSIVRPHDVTTIWQTAVASQPGLIAAVKTAPTVSYGAMIDVLDALHVAGATRVSLEALPGR